MKTAITILLVFLSFSSWSQTQVGARIGTGFTNLENLDDKSNNYTWRQGFYGGLIFNYKLNPEFLLQPEINFSSEGGKKKEIQMVPVGTFTIPGTSSEQPVYADLNTATIIHYLEIPILAKLTVGNRVKYFMCFGPYISFLLDAKRKATGNSVVYLDKAGTKTLKENTAPQTDVSSYFSYETNINDEIKKTNFGFIGGSGFEFSSGPGAFFMECRLKLGMTNINANPAVDGKHQTTCISFSTGYLFNIK